MRPVLLWIPWHGAARSVPVPSYFALVVVGQIAGWTGLSLDLVADGWRLWECAALVASASALGWALSSLWYRVFAGLGPYSTPGRGGESVVGGIAGALAASAAVAVFLHHDVARLFDVAAPWIAVGVAIGRVGCLLAGCDYGRVSHRLPWAVRYPNWAHTEPRLSLLGSPAFVAHERQGLVAPGTRRSLPVHPVPAYWTIGLFSLAAALWSLPLTVSASGAPPLHRLVVAILGYTALTWVTEPLRDDPDRGVFGGRSVAQWTTLLAAATALAMWAVS